MNLNQLKVKQKIVRIRVKSKTSCLQTSKKRCSSYMPGHSKTKAAGGGRFKSICAITVKLLLNIF